VITIERSIVGIAVLINEWNARVYRVLQDRNWEAFGCQLGYFCGLAATFILLAVCQLSQSMASDPPAPLADRRISRALARRRQPLQDATARRRRRNR